MALLRQRDRATLPRVQRFIANSTAVQTASAPIGAVTPMSCFRRSMCELFAPAPAEALEDYFLMVSRLVPYKRFDLAVEAFNALKLPLWIAGTAATASAYKGGRPDGPLSGACQRHAD